MVEYDSQGRMKYHPDYHPNRGQPYTTGDLIFLCSAHRTMPLTDIGLALGRTPASVASLLTKLKKTGEYERYRRLGA